MGTLCRRWGRGPPSSLHSNGWARPRQTSRMPQDYLKSRSPPSTFPMAAANLPEEQPRGQKRRPPGVFLPAPTLPPRPGACLRPTGNHRNTFPWLGTVTQDIFSSSPGRAREPTDQEVGVEREGTCPGSLSRASSGPHKPPGQESARQGRGRNLETISPRRGDSAQRKAVALGLLTPGEFSGEILLSSPLRKRPVTQTKTGLWLVGAGGSPGQQWVCRWRWVWPRKRGRRTAQAQGLHT